MDPAIFPAPPGSPAGSTVRWNYLIVLCLLVISFPGDFNAIRPGLDASWEFAINCIPGSGYLFGRDLVHTMGPLGFLIHPLNVGSNLVYATIVRLAAHAVFGAVLLVHARRANTVWPLLVFAIGYAIALVIVVRIEFSYSLLVLEILLFGASLQSRTLWWIAAPLIGGLAAALLMMKPGVGISALAILVSATALWLLAKPVGSRTILAVAGGSYGLVLVLLAAVCVHSAGYFVAYFRGSMQIADEFPVAQSLFGPRRHAVLAVLSLGVYAGLVVALYLQRSRLRYIAPVFALSLFLAFKHGLVRADGHARNFFPFLLAAISTLALQATNRRDLRTIVASCGLALALALPVGIHFNTRSSLPPFYVTLLGGRGVRNIAATVRLGGTRDQLDRERTQNLAAHPLPPDWVAEIRARRWSVDVIPSELSYVLDTDLHWRPNPTVQAYMAYTPPLDHWSARHYGGADAPEAIIAEFKDFDCRNPLLDNPAVVRSLLAHYEPYRHDLSRNLFLLRKRSSPPPEDLTAAGTTAIRANQWMTVPASNRMLFGEFKMSLSSLGRFAKFVFRIPPVYLECINESGRNRTYRITPEITEDGLLLNYLPADESECYDLLTNRRFDPVARFRIVGPGVAYYQELTTLRWRQGSGNGELH